MASCSEGRNSAQPKVLRHRFYLGL